MTKNECLKMLKGMNSEFEINQRNFPLEASILPTFLLDTLENTSQTIKKIQINDQPVLDALRSRIESLYQDFEKASETNPMSPYVRRYFGLDEVYDIFRPYFKDCAISETAGGIFGLFSSKQSSNKKSLEEKSMDEDIMKEFTDLIFNEIVNSRLAYGVENLVQCF